MGLNSSKYRSGVNHLLIFPVLSLRKLRKIFPYCCFGPSSFQVNLLDDGSMWPTAHRKENFLQLLPICVNREPLLYCASTWH